MTRLGVISDVHGNLPALEAALDAIDDHDVDEIVFCGDAVGVLGWPDECVNRIWAAARHFPFGNHDARMRTDFAYVPQYEKAREEMEIVSEELSETNIDRLNSLPARVETDEYILAHSWPKKMHENGKSVHGFTKGDVGVEPRHATKAGKYANGKVVCLGHTHEQFKLLLDKFQGLSGTIVNPGSVGVPYYTDADFAIVDTETHDVQLLSAEYDSEKVKDRCKELGVTEAK